MSSDVRRTTIEETGTSIRTLNDRICETLRSARDALPVLDDLSTNEHVTKHFDMRLLRDRIDNLIEEIDRTRPPEAARSSEPAQSVHDLSDESLVKRAVCNAAHGRPQRQVRWAHVGDAFALGSTFANQLCRRFDKDPDEQIGHFPDDGDKEETASPSPDPRALPEMSQSGWEMSYRRLLTLNKNLCAELETLRAAAPATTGARAEVVAWLVEDDDTIGLGDSAYPGAFPVYRHPAPPEVTHGAAIGGDVVTDAERYRYLRGEANDDEFCVLVGETGPQEGAALDRAIDENMAARATASTRSDGGDVGRDAK